MRQVVIALFLCLGLLPLSSQPLLITEFVADNRTGITDAEGDNSDWIELENAGSQLVDLRGWSLTDDPVRLTKWQFPSVTLAPGQRILVFASGKDRRNPGLELHTNFQLANEGEFLALVAPDGLTLVQAFSPAYPAQLPDVSFGSGAYRESAPLFSVATSSRFLVPASAEDLPDASWTTVGFDDRAWKAGSLALGYDQAPIPATIQTNLARGRSATQSSSAGAGFAPGRAVDGDLSTFSQTKAGAGTNAIWDLNLGGSFLLDTVVIRNRTDCCQSRLRDLVVSVRGTSGTTFQYESPLLNPEDALGGPAVIRLQFTNEVAGRISGNRLRVMRVLDPDLSGGGTTADDAEVLSMAEVEVFGRPGTNSLAALVQTDLAAEMRNRASSVWIRIPFQDPWAGQRSVEKLLLKIRNNDGYIAYLNGVEVARQNVGEASGWEATATTNRAKALGFSFDVVDLSAFASLIRSNGNVLALRGFSSRAADEEFFIQPLLEATSVRREPGQFLETATPAAGNTGGSSGITASVVFSVERGFYTSPITLALSSATAGAEIRFTLNGSDPAAGGGIRYTNPIPIAKTTPVRAVALKPGWKPGETMSHTYFFLEDVIRQTTQTTLAMGFPASWGGIVADYGMDPRVIGGSGVPDRFGGKYAASIKDDLRSLATLSITIDAQDMFGPNGIYSRSDAGGDAFERRSSAELIETNGASAFQINAGLRIQGGAFRSDGLTKKHSLRLVFNSQNGPTKLRYPLFGPDAADRFDTLTLRANSNDGYSWGDAGAQPLYIRDTFGRDSILDLNGVASHHKFVHLYINGVYWGMYEIVERPDSAFSATYFAGEREEWDSLNSGTPTEGDTRAWDAMVTLGSKGLAGNSNYFRMQGRNPDGTVNPSLPNYLDVENLIDYMIVNLYMGNSDWPHKNYWVGRRRVESAGYKFYMWDAEWSLGLRSDLNTDQTTVNVGVSAPYAACRANAEFKLLFADHLQKHFFDGGALAVDAQYPSWDPEHPERNRPAERFVRLSEQIRRAMVAESARWGDMHAATPYTRDEHWAVERDTQLKSYFPTRSDVVLQQFRRAGLFPALNAPAFSLGGGVIRPGQPLLLGSPVGKILYTLDGSDPRVLGGAVAAAAQEYSGPISLPGRCIVKARVWHTNAWSALREVVFTQMERLPLRLTEIHFRPGAESPASPYFSDDSEFVELKNGGEAPIDLRGVRFTRGIRFDFGSLSNTVLLPGRHLVLARKAAAFLARYGQDAGLVGEFSGTLDNRGERLSLISRLGEVIEDFSYSSSWFPTTDGLGFSLVRVEGVSPPVEPGLAGAWRPSARPGGSPGRTDPVLTGPQVVISEIMARAANGGPDAIEIQNLSAEPADVSGWFLTDDPGVPKKFRIPAGTVLPSGGFKAFAESEFDPRPRVPTGFALSSAGDEVWLFAADAAGDLSGYTHRLRFSVSALGTSFINLQTSEGQEWAVAATTPTLGSANASPLLGEAVLRRLNLAPRKGEIEFIEIQNRGAAALPLYDPSQPTHTWRVSGIGWTFPVGVTLAPGASCFVVRSAPDIFRARYSISSEVQIFGPYSGTLDDGGEAIELQRPDPGVLPARWITVDQVWPRRGTAWPRVWGTGASLTRRSPIGFGSDPLSWMAFWAAPGTEVGEGAAPVLLRQSGDASARESGRLVLQVEAAGVGPLAYQWLRDGQPLWGATQATLTLEPVLSGDGGVYEAVVFNGGGATLSQPMLVTVLEAPVFTRFPASRSALLGASLSLVAAVSTIGAGSYQWWFEGNPINNATNLTFDLPSISTPQSGRYRLQVRDDLGVYLSPSVLIEVVSRPVVVDPPQTLAVLQGQTAVFRVQADGTAPFTFRWRKNGTLLANGVFTPEGATSSLVISNVTSASGGRYSVQITNRAPAGSVISADATLLVLPDTDGDGMEDGWEGRFGLSSTNPNDARLDADGDGYSNLDEYQAGTDPTSPASTLRIDSIVQQGRDVAIGWLAVSNRNYVLLSRDSLGEGAWLPLGGVSNRPTNHVHTVVDPLQSDHPRFYRLTLQGF